MLVSPEGGPNLIFGRDKSSFPVAFYAAQVQDSISAKVQDYKQISEDFLTANDGKDYFRWIYQGKLNDKLGYVRQAMYFFEAGDEKLLIAYTRPLNQYAEYDDQVEESIKSVIFTGPG